MQFNKGEHGFHNNVTDMKTIFRAVGPSFKRGLEVEPFESVHVYELMCKLLGIVPEANDGSLSVLLPMLQETSHGPLSTVPPTLQETSHGPLSTVSPTSPSGKVLPSACTCSAPRHLQTVCARLPCPDQGWPSAVWGCLLLPCPRLWKHPE